MRLILTSCILTSVLILCQYFHNKITLIYHNLNYAGLKNFVLQLLHCLQHSITVWAPHKPTTSIEWGDSVHNTVKEFRVIVLRSRPTIKLRAVQYIKYQPYGSRAEGPKPIFSTTQNPPPPWPTTNSASAVNLSTHNYRDFQLPSI